MSSRYPLPLLPAAWRSLEAEHRTPYFRQLQRFLDEEARTHVVLPPAGDVFRALELTPLRSVRILILGQDPYPTPGHAHGLAFSVQPGVRPPASLRNMYRELESDLGVPAPPHGSLEAWARRGVLLLNTVLTVRAGAACSHRGRGWEAFTDRIIARVSARRRRVVFVLWGAHAQRKTPLIDSSRHAIVASAHPSPLSARTGFFGSRPYSRVNTALAEAGLAAIDWSLPAEP